MAASTGPDVNTYQIPNVELGDTFNVWRDTTNTQTYKLNKMRVYEGVSTSSITMSTAGGGTLSAEIADNVGKGVTFQQPVVFSSGVTFNGDVTFNAQTFTVNANAVTIDDYAIQLGETAGTDDTTISVAGGGGLVLNRGASGSDAEWLWTPSSVHGLTGVWKANANIGFNGTTWGLLPNANGVLPVHGTGIRLDGADQTEHGLQIDLTTGGTTVDRSLQFLRYAPAGSTVFMEVVGGTTHATRPFVKINDGVNRKIITKSAHGFQVGAVLRFDGADYVRALGNSSENAEVIGIVSKYIDTDTFELTFIGEVFGDFSSETDTGAGLVAGRTYYLSPYNAGKITIIQPTASGAVHKAVLIATSATSAVVIPFTGGVLASPLNLANSSSVATTIFQVNRFSLGDVVRFKAYPSGVTLTYSLGAGATLEENYTGGIYVKGQANSAEEAEIAGMVIGLNGATGTNTAYESFDILMDGFFDVSGLSPSVTPGTVYFLSTNSAGTSGAFESATASYTDTEPSSAGLVRKPLFMATGAGSGYLFSYRGDVRGAAVGVTAADLATFLVSDIRSGISGDLSIGVYDTTTSGKETITLSTGYQYDTNSVGACGGYMGVGGGWSVWNTGTSTQNRILADLDLNGAMRLGRTLDSSTPRGQDLLVLRHTGDSPAGVTMVSRVVVGTDYSNANLAIGRAVRPNPTAKGFISSISGGEHRSALVLGVSGSQPLLRWSIAQNNNTTVGNAVSLSDVFSIVGTTAAFAGNFGIGTNIPDTRLTVVSSVAAQQAQIIFANTASGGTAQIGHDLNGDMYLYETVTGKNMRIGTNNTERLRITSDGKVGIANASPAVALDITGEARSSTSTTTASNAKTLTTKDYVVPANIVGVTHGTFSLNGASPVSLFYTYQPLGRAQDTYTIPDGTWFLAGNMYTAMSGSSGNRVDAAFLDAAGNVILRIHLAGGNEGNGTDGGSGMSVRVGWCTGVPKNAKKIVFYRSSGSNGSFDIAITTAFTAYF